MAWPRSGAAGPSQVAPVRPVSLCSLSWGPGGGREGGGGLAWRVSPSSCRLSRPPHCVPPSFASAAALRCFGSRGGAGALQPDPAVSPTRHGWGWSAPHSAGVGLAPLLVEGPLWGCPCPPGGTAVAGAVVCRLKCSSNGMWMGWRGKGGVERSAGSINGSQCLIKCK